MNKHMQNREKLEKKLGKIFQKKIGKKFGKNFSQVFTSRLENISDPAKFVPGFLLNFNVYQEQTLPDQKYFQGNL